MTGHSDIVRFAAPWGQTLRIMTLVGVLILVAIALIGLVVHMPADAPGWITAVWWLSMVVLPLGLVVGGAGFTIRGYTLTPEVLWVERLGWRSRLPLTHLVNATVHPRAMQGSIRTFGNGGLFCFAGRYWSRSLGHYRAYVTDFSRTVILEFPDRKVVVSPDRPAEFVERLHHQR